jgi:ABC-type ATPase involved in cell division
MPGLDVESSERVLQWLEVERERGAVVIVVSHVPGLPERLKARRLRLERGRIVRDSST